MYVCMCVYIYIYIYIHTYNPPSKAQLRAAGLRDLRGPGPEGPGGGRGILITSY